MRRRRPAVGSECGLCFVRIIPFPQGALQVVCQGSMKILRTLVKATRNVRDFFAAERVALAPFAEDLRRYDIGKLRARRVGGGERDGAGAGPGHRVRGDRRAAGRVWNHQHGGGGDRGTVVRGLPAHDPGADECDGVHVVQLLLGEPGADRAAGAS